jgi:hypothetical protein
MLDLFTSYIIFFLLLFLNFYLMHSKLDKFNKNIGSHSNIIKKNIFDRETGFKDNGSSLLKVCSYMLNHSFIVLNR